ncbi:gamma-glutamyltransferase family protein [Natrononativus amylolyticus]|uniref:gamma-glutamyltransferase family protein n=1 Tax=Natrononativus amylolyticus TaxID=2963434 RepID=UPI0020CCDBA3|nr:gamma-glutamyltransferase [Natrononativus amylolyticus]
MERRTFIKGTASTAAAAGLLSQGAVADEHDVTEEYPGRAIPRGPEDIPTARSRRGVVSSLHPEATQAGLDVLEDGGNAVDAAAVMQAVLAVVAPNSTGLAGGGFMTVYSAETGRTHLLNYRDRAPTAASGELHAESGIGRVHGVPGVPRGMDFSLKRWGTRDFEEVFDSAIDLAENGVEVDLEFARRLNNTWENLGQTAREAFSPDGQGEEPLQEGDTMVQPGQANTMTLLRDEGVEAFYQGEIAEAIAETVQDHGGYMTVDDIARYRVVEDRANWVEFGGVDFAFFPSVGGYEIPLILRVLEELDVDDLESGTSEFYHRYLEAMRMANADGNTLGDHHFVDIPNRGFFSDGYLEERASLVNPDAHNPATHDAGDPWDYQPGSPYRSTGHPSTGELEHEPFDPEDLDQTTHFVVADEAGNVVAWTSTLSVAFVSGNMVPDYGMMLSYSIGGFSLSPGPTELQPLKRRQTQMCPTIGLRRGEPVVATGSPGPTVAAVSQVLTHLYAFDMDLDEALAEPRVEAGWGGSFGWEETLDEAVRDDLEAKGHSASGSPGDTGMANTLIVEPNGTYEAAADPRRDAYVGAIDDGRGPRGPPEDRPRGPPRDVPPEREDDVPPGQSDDAPGRDG